MPVVARNDRAGPLWAATKALILSGSVALMLLAIAGAAFPLADSAVILAPYWLGIGLIALLAVVLVERRRRGRRNLRGPLAALIAFAILGAFLLSPLATAAARPGAGPRYRIVSFNMYKANADPARVAEWLAGQDADFIVLLEVSNGNRPEMLAGLRQRYPFVYSCSRSGRCSTMILSRRPAIDDWPLAKGDADNRQALSAVTARFRLDGGILPLTAVHLDRPWPLGAQHRQMEDLTNALATVGRGGVAAGDFNSAPWTFAARRLAQAGDMRLASGARGTWPSDQDWAWLRLPLDQVYLGACLEAESVAVGPDLASDHLPVIVDIRQASCRG